MKLKKRLLNSLVVGISVLITLLICEGVFRLYVHQVREKTEIFELDKQLGWKVKSNLHTRWKNHDGDPWHIDTDADGLRNPSVQSPLKKKLLILGDSFAFGQGVEIEDRFDGVKALAGFDIINTGVMGYGTDQQILSAERYLSKLDSGDQVVILTYFNDFYDILHKVQSGRAKPWYHLVNDKLKLNPPAPTSIGRLQLKSYLLTEIIKRQRTYSYPPLSELQKACDIYQALIQSFSEKLASKHISVHLLYHGLPVIPDESHQALIKESLIQTCNETPVSCISLDRHFNYYQHADHFLGDGHWNKKGNQVVGELLSEYIRNSQIR